jgi:uncharacterized damage-inducible protein DinB
MNNEAAELFRRYSMARLEKHSASIDDCLGRLTPEQVWWRASEAQNAIGNLALHLCGHVRQRITLSLAGGTDIRNRDAEFDTQARVSTEELRQRLKSTIADALAVLRQFPAGRLTEPAPKPGYDCSALENVYAVVEHFALHTGQIIFATKQLTKQGLGELGRWKKPQ